MSLLETILAPFKGANKLREEVDTMIARQYAKMCEGMETEEKIKTAQIGSSIGFGVSTISVPYSFFLTDPKGISDASNYFLRIFSPMVSSGLEWVTTSAAKESGTTADGTIETENGKIIKIPFLYKFSKIETFARAPLFVYGTYLLVKAGIELCDSLANGTNASEGANDLLHGISYVATSSAIYIKSSDPKVLDKSTIRERITEYFRPKQIAPVSVEK